MSVMAHDVGGSDPVAATGNAGGTMSPAGVVGYALGRAGLWAEVTVRGFGTAGPGDFFGEAERAAVGVYLREGVGVGALEAILRGFLASNHGGCLILAPAAPEREYGERLHVDGEARVVRVERRFRRAGEAAVRPDRVVGSIVRLGEGQGMARGAGRSVFALVRSGLGAGGSMMVTRLMEPAIGRARMEGDILRRMSAEERRELAGRLGFERVGEDCYAGAGAKVAEGAFLRGPLFIDPGVMVGAMDIHLGPGWLRAGGPGVTMAEGGRAAGGAADVIAPPPHGEGYRKGEYFVGPRARAKPTYDLCKRVFDFCFALFWLLALSPILLATALAIKLYDLGPMFFVHEREGLHGKPFGCVKFRSMVRNAEAMKEKLKAQNLVDGPQFKVAKDPRITPIGRFIRMTNIDELPQLWNVLWGDMSIVGPRPSPFKENQLCPPWREARLSVKPGITGLWQVSRSRERGAADFQEWIVYDTQYVERRGFFLDMKLILLTVKEILGKGQ